MDIQELIDQTIKHTVFGEGKIIKTAGNLFDVQFDADGKISRFSYPAAFRTFLSCTDDNIQKCIIEDINNWLVESGTLAREQLKAKTAVTQKEITEREVQRQKARLLKAKAEASRSRFFAGLENSRVEMDEEGN